MSRTTLAALTLAATALAASGCGGSSSGGSSSSSNAATTGTTTATTAKTATVTPPAVRTVAPATGTPLSRARLVAKANAICARTNAKLAAIGFITPKELERVFPEEAAYRTVEADELSKLVPPASLTHVWSAVINDFHVYAVYSQATVPYMRANNLRGAIPLVKPAEKAQSQLRSDATHAGIARCATTT